ncbi:MAG: MBL fold metallo-hydrolase [Acidobacteriota bacterium]
MLAAFVLGCSAAPRATDPQAAGPFVVVLGIAQDGGFPQAGCRGEQCRRGWEDLSLQRHVASLALVDPESKQRWLIDVTPDFPEQLAMLDRIAPPEGRAPALSAIFLTHAHIGHYTGLMFLGREVLGTASLPVYAMPRMFEFIENNGPWNQLVRLHNVELRPLNNDQPVTLTTRISITPILVPHRDEYSETVGFIVRGPRRSVLYIPDIDKWERWDRRLEDVLASVDQAFIDGTFYADGELPGRNMTEIPHPFIQETMARLATASAAERNKVWFIHLNQSNPAMLPGTARTRIERSGFHVADEGMKSPL